LDSIVEVCTGLGLRESQGYRGIPAGLRSYIAGIQWSWV